MLGQSVACNLGGGDKERKIYGTSGGGWGVLAKKTESYLPTTARRFGGKRGRGSTHAENEEGHGCIGESEEYTSVVIIMPSGGKKGTKPKEKHRGCGGPGT